MSKGNESMDEHEELVDGGWIAERMGIARPSVARIMARRNACAIRKAA